MDYILKSGLSKSVIYNAVVDNGNIDIIMPPMRYCTFRRVRNCYYLGFDQTGCSWKVSIFQRWNDTVQCCFIKGEYAEGQEGFCCIDSFPPCVLPFDYLLKHQMLRKVPGPPVSE